MTTTSLNQTRTVSFILVGLVACSSPQQLGVGEGEAGAGATSVTSTGGTSGHSVTVSGGLPSSTGGTLHLTANSGSAGNPQGGTGGGGESSVTCTGSVDEFNQIWGFACPATYCEAKSLGACDSLPALAKSSALSACGAFGASVVTFYLEGTLVKSCYYVANQLKGAKALGDSPSFCSNTSFSMNVGDFPTSCASSTITLCDRSTSNGSGGATGNGGASGSGGTTATNPPAASCYNSFSATCQPCCAATAPDCSDKLDGYPGYACTPAPLGGTGGSPSTEPWVGNTYCSCQCSAGKWGCGC